MQNCLTALPNGNNTKAEIPFKAEASLNRIFNNLVCTSSIIKINWLIKFKEITAINSENHVKTTNNTMWAKCRVTNYVVHIGTIGLERV
jgi:hypothetical protein